MSIGPLYKIDEYEMDTAWGDRWKVTLLGDKETQGHKYTEAHIKKIGGVVLTGTR